jgi:hypothetical protein
MTVERETREDVIARLAAAVPTGKKDLSSQDTAVLLAHTVSLLEAAGATGAAEFGRFRAMKDRSLLVDPQALHRAHHGATVLVTGGTGCIGSSLLTELSRLAPGRLVSISRGVTEPWTVVDGVDYLHADIRDTARLAEVFDLVKPDIVYHLAAQHDPGLAEIEVARTLSTNVTGTANVIAACLPHGAKLVHASTGKALRPFSADIYAASKKLAEWLLTQAMGADQLSAATARFTHVVDNSIIYDRLQSWTDSGSVVRLHSADSSFYLQSAKEAAQLLLCAGLGAVDNELRIAAIRDLGWPISLIDLAVGWLDESGVTIPLYVCGFEAGYDKSAYPGLYDPKASGDRSPLFNAFEAPHATISDYSADVDVCAIDAQKDPATLALIQQLGRLAADDADPAVLRAHVEECGWAVLASSVGSLATTSLTRHLDMVQRIPHRSFDRADREVVNIVFWEALRRTQVQGAPRPLAPGDQGRAASVSDRGGAPHSATGHSTTGHSTTGHSAPGHSAPGHSATGHGGPGPSGPGSTGPGHDGPHHSGPSHGLPQQSGPSQAAQIGTGPGHSGSGHSGSGHSGSGHSLSAHGSVGHSTTGHAVTAPGGTRGRPAAVASSAERSNGAPHGSGGAPTATLAADAAESALASGTLQESLLQTVDLTVVIPTYNERENIPVLVQRLSAACRDLPVEILFVDDSVDDTPDMIRASAAAAGMPIRLLHRTGVERTGGLSGAVAAGAAQAMGRYILVMDGDLQHPPELVPVLREVISEPGVQLAVATRYTGNGRAPGLDGAWRHWVSNWSTTAARSLFPRRVGNKCSDPMTGFFCLDTTAVDFANLRPQGFKILLEILVRHDLTVREVPFVFEERNAGTSKASLKQGVIFLRQLIQLRTNRP